MATSLTINGVSYNYPETGDNEWGTAATDWATAVTNGMLQKAGGSFILTAEVDFGASHGLASLYFRSRSSNPAATGVVRFANDEGITWRNNANSGDLLLKVNSSDQLEYNGGSFLTAPGALTASRALVTNSSAEIVSSTVTSAEVGYLSGVTSAIQTQLAGKAALDGDILDIDWNPTYYQPTTAPSEVTSVDELTAHLAGIDAYFGLPKQAGAFTNLGLGIGSAATTLRIRSASGNLSSTSPLHIVLPSTTAGLLSMFSATANVDIVLTGAHWGLGTKGDFSDVELCVYAINDTGALKWGVSLDGAKTTIASADSDTTATNITAKGDMLVSSALNSGTWPCVRVGWVKADFDDTGGASEDIWDIQTGVGDINVGVPLPTSTPWTSYTPNTVALGTVTVDAAQWRRNGPDMEIQARITGGTMVAATAAVDLPSGYQIDTAAFASTTRVGTMVSANNGADSVLIASTYTGGMLFGAVLSPQTGADIFTNGETFSFYARVPIVQWGA